MVINVENESLVSFKFEVLYIPLFSGHLPADSTHFHELVKTLLPESGYFMCQGLSSEVSSQMIFKTKSARFWGIPFVHVDHNDCPLWLVAMSATGLSSVCVHKCDKCPNLIGSNSFKHVLIC